MVHHIQMCGVGIQLCSVTIILNLVQIGSEILNFKIFRVRHLESVWMSSVESMHLYCLHLLLRLYQIWFKSVWPLKSSKIYMAAILNLYGPPHSKARLLYTVM